MNPSIDLVKFQKSSGDLKWLPVVAAAFLRQLPQWRQDFETAVATNDGSQQVDLLHKIKGSCYAVAAYNAVEVVIQAEAQQARGETLMSRGVLAQMALVESELQAIIASAPK